MVNNIYLNKSKKFVILINIFIIAITLVSLFSGSKIAYSKEIMTNLTRGSTIKNVLILNSYSRSYAWTSKEIAGAVDYMINSKYKVNTYLEYMALDKTDSGYSPKDFIKSKYDNVKIDVIITTDKLALEFALNNRKEIFSDTPIVFTGIYENAAKNIIEKYDNVTGVFENVDAVGTLNTAFRIFPETENIYLLHDDTEIGVNSFNEVKASLNVLGKNINLIEVNNIRVNDLKNSIPKISDKSIVVLSTYNKDADGNHLNFGAMTKLLSENIKEPVFALYATSLGYGAIGGSVLTPENEGEEAAEIAIRLLMGEKTEYIKPSYDEKFQDIYDYNVMDKHGIKKSHLPAKSTIINNTYYNKIISRYSVVIVLLLISVGFMLLNIKKRKKIQEKLIKNNNELSNLYEELAEFDKELKSQYELLEENKKIIQDNEEKYRLLFESSNDAMWEIDLENNKTVFSNKWYEEFDIATDKELSLEQWFEFVHPDEYEMVKHKTNEILSGIIDTYSITYRALASDGNYKWIYSRAKLIRDDSGSVSRVIGSHSDISDKKVHEEKIYKMAFFDDLTGLANRSQFMKDFSKVIDEEEENTLVLMDVDNFKNINDSFGHTIGDELLIEISNRIKNCFRDFDLIARFGGDEFLILIKGVVDKQEIEKYIKNVLQEIRNPIIIHGIDLIASASFGISRYPYDGNNFEELFKNADSAMYKAKELGKSNYMFFEKWMTQDIVDAIIMEDYLRKAIAKEEFMLYYQPKYDLKNSKIRGFEALIRWNSPELGFVSPFKFIDIAEKNGLIIPIGTWVLESACNALNSLHKKGYSNLSISVNVSVIQLLQKDFIDVVKSVIKKTGANTKYIDIEITESALMKSMDTNIAKIKQLKEMGFKIFLDDFGRGYSSFAYLKDIPFDTLKIDKSFIDEIPKRGEDVRIVSTIINLAHHMNLKVIAEGVETKEQLDCLLDNECDLIQGYYIAKPMPISEVDDALKKYNK